MCSQQSSEGVRHEFQVRSDHNLSNHIHLLSGLRGADVFYQRLLVIYEREQGVAHLLDELGTQSQIAYQDYLRCVLRYLCTHETLTEISLLSSAKIEISPHHWVQ